MKSVICTLFEGDYHFGIASLVNSLYHNGFSGRIYAGYRGNLPPWAEATVANSSGVSELLVGGNVLIEFIPLETVKHFTNIKPAFLLDVMENRARDAENVFYFDPDIVVLCRWSFFEEWVKDGISLCGDINWYMPHDHPIRNGWRNYFAKKNISLDSVRNNYLNAGFIGIDRTRHGFLHEWHMLLDASESDQSVLVYGDRTQLFRTPDQDALNAATMFTSWPLSTVGPDGMDFQNGGGGYIMSHAAGGKKPWAQCYLLEALRGHRMSRAARQYLRFVNGPIRPYSRHALLLRKLDSVLARATGRIVA